MAFQRLFTVEKSTEKKAGFTRLFSDEEESLDAPLALRPELQAALARRAIPIEERVAKAITPVPTIKPFTPPFAQRIPIIGEFFRKQKEEVDIEKAAREEAMLARGASEKERKFARNLPTLSQIQMGVIGAVSPLKPLTSAEASKLLVNANKLRWQDISDITAGRKVEPAKLEAFKIVSQDKALLQQALARKGKISFSQMIKDIVQENLKKIREGMKVEPKTEIAKPKELPPAIPKELKPLVAEVGFAVDKRGVQITSPFGDKLPLNKDGTITVYHRTTPEGVRKILQEGLVGSRAEKGYVFVSTNPLGGRYIGKEKTEVLQFRIDPRKFDIDETFRDGSIDLKAKTEDLVGIKPIPMIFEKPTIKPREEIQYLKDLRLDIEKGIAKKTQVAKQRTEIDLAKLKTTLKLTDKTEQAIRKQELSGFKQVIKERTFFKADQAIKINKLIEQSERALRKKELQGFKKLIEERSASDQIIKRITDRAIRIADNKREIFEFAKRVLPLKSRGKLLADVANAETKGEIASAFRHIMTIRNENVRKELINSIEKIADNIEKVPLRWQDKISVELDSISFKGMRQETIDKLTKLKEFLQKEPEAKLQFGRKTLAKARKIELLEKQNIADIPIRDLMKLETKISHIFEEGKVAKQVIAETEVLKREAVLKELKTVSHNIDKTLPRTIGQKLTPKEKLVNARYQIADQMTNGYMNYVSTDIGFEILDNNVRNGRNYRIFKKPFDEVYFNFKEMSQDIVDSYFDFKKGLETKYGIKLEQDTMERIMIFATKMQEGGTEKLLKSGIQELLPQGMTIENLKLSPIEQELYQYMRGVFDELYPHIDATLQKTRGTKLGKVDNYFSWQTDFNNSEEVFKRLESDYILSSRTAQGFTKERTIAGRQALKLNAEDVFLKHINDASYFIHTEELLNDIGKIARAEEYAEAVGKNGRKWVMGWIDLMARKGIPEGYQPSWYHKILRNIGAGVLGFRISPIVKQPIAKITSSALLGIDTFRYDKDFFAQGLSRYVRNISKQQEFRSFDDPAFVELAKNKKLAQWQEWGYAGIKWVDQYIADSTWYAAYRKYHNDNNLIFSLDDFKTGKANKDASDYADWIVRRTQGTGEAKDLARMLTSSKKDTFKAFLQFQSFILNESYLIPHDAIGVAIRTEQDYFKAIGIITAIIISGLAEDYVSSGIAQLFSPEKYAKEEREKKFMNRIFESIVSKIPFINKVYSLYKYDSIGIPLLETPTKTIQGGISIIEGKKPETKIKGLSRLIEGLGQMLGIAGIGQAGQAFRKFIVDGISTSTPIIFPQRSTGRLRGKPVIF